MNSVALNEQQFQRNAQTYADTRQARDSQAHRRLVAAAGTAPDEVVLDVACGPGLLTCELARVAQQVIGVDITPNFLQMAEQKAKSDGLDNVSFRRSEAARLPFPDNSFDLAISRAAFHHFTDPAAVIAEMVRITSPSGRIVIADMVSSEDRAQADYHNILERLCDKSHARALSVSSFHWLIRAAGLDIALERESTIDYPSREWIGHAGADRSTCRALEHLLDRAIKYPELTDLNIRRHDGEMHLTHRTRLFVCTPV